MRHTLLTLLVAAALPAAGQTLAEAIQAHLSAPAAQKAVWSVHVRDLATKTTLFAHQAAVPFTPASNTKLYASALALQRLGADHRFVTRVLAPAAPGSDGVVRGPLVLAGGGDPTMSWRPYPYQKDAPALPPLAAWEALADQVVAAGVRVVLGGVVGDDTWFPFEPYPEGWTVDDMVWEYGAPLSALVFNDNAVNLTIRPPRRAGESVLVALSPGVEALTIVNKLRAGRGLPSAWEARRAPGSNVVTLTGTVPLAGAPVVQRLALNDPALAAAQVFQRLLEERGVTFRGAARARHREPGTAYAAPEGVEVARRTSPPLKQILQVVNKVSQNLHAEIVLREAARVARGDGSREAAMEELTQFLRSLGIPNDHFDFFDGSGLSRKTLVTSSATTRLLEVMAETALGADFVETLPVGGEDGSLAARFRKAPEASRLRAKTGTLAHVSGLSGYILDRSGAPRLAFSIFVNHVNGPSSLGRETLDKIAEEILKAVGS